MFYFNFTTRTLTGGQMLDSTRTAGPFSSSGEAVNFRAFLEHVYGASLLESGSVYVSDHPESTQPVKAGGALIPFRV
jgi:hypothetical protein